ncbi:hypothetical protein F5882DRAFT_126375 [Hyaloscypha sp. PMI_1271]|nr:hypothetical protein F5882DRAFT_126375 [Hyaloscypha sp. PMI_1271]
MRLWIWILTRESASALSVCAKLENLNLLIRASPRAFCPLAYDSACCHGLFRLHARVGPAFGRHSTMLVCWD